MERYVLGAVLALFFWASAACGPPSVDDLTDELGATFMAEKEDLVRDVGASRQLSLELAEQALALGCPVLTDDQRARAVAYDRTRRRIAPSVAIDLRDLVIGCEANFSPLAVDLERLTVVADQLLSNELPAGLRVGVVDLLAETADAGRIEAGSERILEFMRADLRRDLSRFSGLVDVVTRRSNSLLELLPRSHSQFEDLLRQIEP